MYVCMYIYVCVSVGVCVCIYIYVYVSIYPQHDRDATQSQFLNRDLQA